MAPFDAKIVIVGCGISGVGAAVKLFKQGFRDVHIIEATGRSGGRIRSGKFGNNNLELGAAWIQGPSQENPVFRLACQYGLLDPKSMTKKNQAVDLGGDIPLEPSFLSSSGGRISTWSLLSVVELYSEVMGQCRSFGAGEGGHSVPVPSVGEYMKAELPKQAEKHWTWCWGPSKKARKMSAAVWSTLLKGDCNLHATNSMDEISLEMLGRFRHLPGLDCTFPRGYNGLIDCLMRELPEGVVTYNTPVSSIHWSDSPTGDTHPVRVECANGQVFPADHVIVTIPLGYLKKHHDSLLSPPLPKHKLDSVQRMGFGTVNKIYLEFEKPFWKKDVEAILLVWEDETQVGDTVDDIHTQWQRKLLGFTVLTPSERYGHVLCGWIAGHEAEYMETLPESEVLNTMTQVLRKFTGDPTVTPTKILRTQWSQDEYTCGSYSNPAVGSSVQDIQNLAEPLPSGDTPSRPLQVLFAGEATHECFWSTAHGALLSGWREAERLITHHSHSSSSS